MSRRFLVAITLVVAACARRPPTVIHAGYEDVCTNHHPVGWSRDGRNLLVVVEGEKWRDEQDTLTSLEFVIAGEREWRFPLTGRECPQRLHALRQAIAEDFDGIVVLDSACSTVTATPVFRNTRMLRDPSEEPPPARPVYLEVAPETARRFEASRVGSLAGLRMSDWRVATASLIWMSPVGSHVIAIGFPSTHSCSSSLTVVKVHDTPYVQVYVFFRTVLSVSQSALPAEWSALLSKRVRAELDTEAQLEKHRGTWQTKLAADGLGDRIFEGVGIVQTNGEALFFGFNDDPTGIAKLVREDKQLRLDE